MTDDRKPRRLPEPDTEEDVRLFQEVFTGKVCRGFEHGTDEHVLAWTDANFEVDRRKKQRAKERQS